MNGNVFAQVRYQQLILFTSLVIHNKNANMILHIMNSTMSSGSLVFIILIGCLNLSKMTTLKLLFLLPWYEIIKPEH